MTGQEILLRILVQVQPFLPYMLVVTAATAAVLPALLWLGRGIWVGQRRFRWMSLFLGLRGGECLRLACAWIKLLLLLAFLIGFRKLSVLHYLLLVVPGVLYAVSPRRPLQIPGRLFWLALETVALLSCNLICGYIHDMEAGIGFWIVYILMAIFTALFGCYLFLTELNDISAGRSADFEKEWNDTGAA